MCRDCSWGPPRGKATESMSHWMGGGHGSSKPLRDKHSITPSLLVLTHKLPKKVLTCLNVGSALNTTLGHFNLSANHILSVAFIRGHMKDIKHQNNCFQMDLTNWIIWKTCHWKADKLLETRKIYSISLSIPSWIEIKQPSWEEVCWDVTWASACCLAKGSEINLLFCW